MLFSYQYVPHRIETFKAWLDHLVKQVWCRHGGVYSIDLLHPGLRAVVLEIYNTEDDKPVGKAKDYLFGPIQRIDRQFQQSLDAVQRNRFRDWYDYNNDIDAICACNPVTPATTYEDVRAINSDLANELAAFCTSLWSNVLGLKPVEDRIGKIDGHYKDFVAVNKAGKCPYCGYNDIKGTHHTRREAYDHYLPKGIYPFNSVNFRNLAPMCHECNSSYKLQLDSTRHIDPAKRRNTGARRKAFYTYTTASPNISINLTLNTKDVTNLKPHEIDLQLAARGYVEEVEAWREVFGIDERYKAKCCAEYDGKVWLSRVTEEHQNYGLTPEAMLAAEVRAAENKPWSDANFLKKPFLLACQNASLI